MTMIQPSSLFKMSKIAAALLLCSSIVYADEAVQQTEETTAQTTKNSNVFTLGTVVVSASMPQTSELFESYISKETIDLLEAKDVGEALQYTPGIFYDSPIASGNSGRFESGVTVRGYGLRYVPIYVDGIPVYIPYDGYSDMGRFSTADISSIQVAKGYSSVMYGHNTMGGAVNIVTMKPRSEFDFSSVVGGGSGGMHEASVNVGTLQENWYLQAGLSERTQKYTRLAEKYEGIDAEGQMVDSDKYLYNVKDRRANIKFGWTPNATDEYVLSYSKQKAEKYPGQKGKNGFVPTTWKWPTWDRETISFVSTTWLMDDKVYIKPRIYYDTYKNTLTGWRGDPKGSHYDDKAFGASVEVGTTVISNHLVKMMLSYKDETHKSFDTFPNSALHMPDSDSKATQKFYSIALEDTITFNEQWEAQLGVVYTKRTASASDIGINTQHLLNAYPAANSMLAPSYNSTDFQAALFYKPTDLDTFRFAVGKKTRFPSFKESYSNYAGGSEKKCPKGQTGCKAGEFVPSITLQNPGLKPESALNIELGYNGTPIDGLTMDAALFYSQSKDA
ncbi:MAG: TonB-dependent receptor plug domain-containing protein, partial [Wohlfahrtiimonas sp.]